MNDFTAFALALVLTIPCAFELELGNHKLASQKRNTNCAYNVVNLKSIFGFSIEMDYFMADSIWSEYSFAVHSPP